MLKLCQKFWRNSRLYCVCSPAHIWADPKLPPANSQELLSGEGNALPIDVMSGRATLLQTLTPANTCWQRNQSWKHMPNINLHYWNWRQKPNCSIYHEQWANSILHLQQLSGKGSEIFHKGVINFLCWVFASELGFFGEGGWGWGDGVNIVLFVSFTKRNICNFYQTNQPYFWLHRSLQSHSVWHLLA